MYEFNSSFLFRDKKQREHVLTIHMGQVCTKICLFVYTTCIQFVVNLQDMLLHISILHVYTSAWFVVTPTGHPVAH